MEPADGLVVACHGTLALQDVNLYGGLVVGRSREDLALAGRYRRVGVDKLGEDAAQGFDTQRQRGDVQQEHVLHFARQHAALYGRADGYHLVRIHVLGRRLAEEVLYDLLDGRNTGGTAHEDNLVDILRLHTRILKRLAARLDGGLYQPVAELFEFGPCQRRDQVLRNTVYRHDVRQVDFRLRGARKLDFRLFGSFFQALHRHRVLAQVDVVVLHELLCQPVDDDVVEVIAAQMRVAVGRFYFEDAVAQLQDGNIERTASQVVHGYLHVLVGLVQTVSQRGGRRLVDDTAYLQTGDFARLLGGLTLRVGEVGRYGDDRLVHRGTEVIFRRLLHLLENDGRNLLRSIFTPVHLHARHVVLAYHRVGDALDVAFHLPAILTHEPLDGKDGVLRVGDGLPFGRVAHFALAAVGERHDGRGGAVPLAVGYYNGFVAFHYCYAGVGCS